MHPHARAQRMYVDDHAGEFLEAMCSVLMWNVIYHPLESVVVPVSRSWDFGSGYVLFNWDGYFASLMLQHQAKLLAYSNIIQVTKSKTWQGITDTGTLTDRCTHSPSTSIQPAQPGHVDCL